jgi:choline kinase
MRALIVAAGRGTRLRPLTDDRPKCLVRLGGRSLLAWQLGALRHVGITEIAVVLGWRRARVRARGVQRFVNPDWRRTTMVASLLAARAWLARGPCVVAYGDVVFHPAIVRRLARAAADLAISYDVAWRALWDARFTRAEDDGESLRVARGRVVEIGRPLAGDREPDGQFMGLLRVTPRGVARLARGAGSADRRLDTTALLDALVAAGGDVAAVPVRGRWCEIDSIRDLTLYERRLASGRPWLHDWRWREDG